MDQQFISYVKFCNLYRFTIDVLKLPFVLDVVQTNPDALQNKTVEGVMIAHRLISIVLYLNSVKIHSMSSIVIANNQHYAN